MKRKKPRHIEGTTKFVVYLYNARALRGTHLPRPKDFVFRQWGRVVLKDQNDRTIEDYPFTDFGDMLTFINTAMRRRTRTNLKVHGTWR
jgi:hypothetical protein